VKRGGETGMTRNLDREALLAAALRANLKRRKRAPSPDKPPPPAPPPAPEPRRSED
jgi:hypothetical protein